MYKCQKENEALEIIFNSVYSNVEKAIPDIDQFLKKYTHEDLNDFHLVLRELCNNAIEHGNKENEDEIVLVKIKKIDVSAFELSVSDNGEGFDHSKINLTLSSEEYQERARGFAFINNFVKRLEFNEKGNKVTVEFVFLKKTTFKVTEKDKIVTIIPKGNLVGEIKKEFLEIINPFIKKDCVKINLDLSEIKEVDSIGLSILFIFGKSIKDNNPGCTLAIENADIKLIDLFYKTGLNKIIRIV